MSDDGSMVKAEAWIIFDKNRIQGLKKTTRFNLKAGQRAVRLELHYRKSLFDDEFPTVKVQLNDKRDILDRDIGVRLAGEGEGERQVVDPEDYVDDLVNRLIDDGEIAGLPLWAHVSVQAELDRRDENTGGVIWDYDAGLEEVDGEAVRYIRLDR